MSNVFDALEERIERERQETDGEKRLRTGRVDFIRGRADRVPEGGSHNLSTNAFFAILSLRLELIVNWAIETCAVDGKAIHFNPKFMSELERDEAVFVVAHEVLHMAQQHHARRHGRDLELWNIACDLAINWILVMAKIGKAPKGAYIPGQGEHAKMPGGLSAEEYYARLQQQKQEQEQDQEQDQDQEQPGDGGGAGDGDGDGDGEGDGEGSGQGQCDPGGCGTFMEPGDGSASALRECEQEWTQAVAEATQAAKMRGDLPGSLADMVTKILAPKVDWRDQLREFLTSKAKNDYTWAKPSRRLAWAGIFLPGMQSEELGHVGILVDGSGSCWDQAILSRFGSEVQGILDSFDCKVTLIYHDVEVHHIEEWDRGKGPLVLTPRGGGGTSHVPAFQAVEKLDEPPVCVIALTDLATSFPRDPGYPVLWACVRRGGATAPFGSVIDVE
jgi:predicted metal-dependent peptidase